MSTTGSALAPNLVSLMRPLLGVALFWSLASTRDSTAVLPLVLLACASDYVDGRLARRRGLERFSGRLIDNLCDAAFLGLAFAAMAHARLWSDPATGILAPALPQVNALPLVAFVSAFGAYLLRLLLERRRGGSPGRSRYGHLAGISNYGLAIAGGVEALPSLHLPALLLEPGFVAVAALNIVAVLENLRLMFPRSPAGPTMAP